MVECGGFSEKGQTILEQTGKMGCGDNVGDVGRGERMGLDKK